MTIDVHTFKVMDCSTLHVEPADMELLAASDSVTAYTDDYGAWVHVPADDTDEHRAAIVDDGFSELFVAIIDAALAADCRYVRLDADGPANDGLGVSTNW